MKILITGASGQLGAYLLDQICETGHDALGWSGPRPAESPVEFRNGVRFEPVDLADLDAIEPALERADPGAIVHAAAVSSAEACRLDPARAEVVNVRATRRIAEWAESRRRRLVFTSTDLVFGGDRPLRREDDPAEPTLAYGRTKLDAERAVLAFGSAAVARLPLLYGPGRSGRPSFFDRSVAALGRGEPQAFFADEFRTPLDYASAARGLVRLALSDFAGLVHLAGPERLSRFELMARAARALGLDPTLVRANRQADAPAAEPRPADASLDGSRWRRHFPDLAWPTIEAALGSQAGSAPRGA